MFSGIGVGSYPTANPIGVCDPTLIQLFFDMWDRRIVKSYDSDPDFNNLGYIWVHIFPCNFGLYTYTTQDSRS